MFHTQEFGILLKHIAHDFKNQLGILETLIRDVKSGYKVDQESCDASLEAVRKIHSLSKTLQLGGMELEKTGRLPHDKTSPISGILTLVHHALKEELKPGSSDKLKKEYLLSVSCSEFGSFMHKETIRGASNESIEETFKLLFPYPKAGTSSTSRTSIALAQLTMKITQVSRLEVKLFCHQDTARVLYSAFIT